MNCGRVLRRVHGAGRPRASCRGAWGWQQPGPAGGARTVVAGRARRAHPRRHRARRRAHRATCCGSAGARCCGIDDSAFDIDLGFATSRWAPPQAALLHQVKPYLSRTSSATARRAAPLGPAVLRPRGAGAAAGPPLRARAHRRRSSCASSSIEAVEAIRARRLPGDRRPAPTWCPPSSQPARPHPDDVTERRDARGGGSRPRPDDPRRAELTADERRQLAAARPRGAGASASRPPRPPELPTGAARPAPGGERRPEDADEHRPPTWSTSTTIGSTCRARSTRPRRTTCCSTTGTSGRCSPARDTESEHGAPGRAVAQGAAPLPLADAPRSSSATTSSDEVAGRHRPRLRRGRRPAR